MTAYSLGYKQTDRIVFILTVFLLSCFIIFEKYEWGKYALFVASGLVYLVDLSISRRLVLRIDILHKCYGMFVIFCFSSVLWAISKANALEWSRSLLNNLICITLIFPYYSRKKDISMLLSIIMWSSHFISLYTIWFYGLEKLFASSYTQNVRLGNDFSNINTIGMFCAFGLLVQIESMISEKRIRWYVVFFVPELIVVAATQSRKAAMILLLGILIIALLNNTDKRNAKKTIVNTIGILLVVSMILYGVSLISIFSGVTERLNQLFSVVTGSGELDSGTINRQNYIQLGIQTWLQYPLGGVGINCTKIVNQRAFGESVYLHNNYVELLCGVGIVGFIVYYFMYFYIIRTLLKNRLKKPRFFNIGITWIILLLIADYGMVSYYSKIQAFYFMMMFLNVKCLKNYQNGSAE